MHLTTSNKLLSAKQCVSESVNFQLLVNNAVLMPSARRHLIASIISGYGVAPSVFPKYGMMGLTSTSRPTLNHNKYNHEINYI